MKYLLFLLVWLSHYLHAQELGKLNSTVTNTTAWSILYNPAGLSLQKKTTLGLEIQQPYGLKELGKRKGIVVLPLSNGKGLGMAISYDGFSLYHQLETQLSYGQSLSKLLYIGMSIRYKKHVLQEESTLFSSHLLGVDLSFLAYISPKVSLGGKLTNPFRCSLNSKKSLSLAPQISFGASYYPILQTGLHIAITKSAYHIPSISTQLDYSLHSKVFFSVKTSSSPFTYELGVGMKYHKTILQFDIERHPILGYTPQCATTISF